MRKSVACFVLREIVAFPGAVEFGIALLQSAESAATDLNTLTWACANGKSFLRYAIRVSFLLSVIP